MKKNEKKKNGKRRLLLLVLLLVFSLSLMIVSSYAWFTSNKVVDVTNLDVNVRAVNGLEISADAEAWGVRVTKEMLTVGYEGDSNQLPDILGAASTTGTVTNNLMDLYSGIVETSCADGTTTCDNPTYRLTTSKSAEAKCYDSIGVTANTGPTATCTGKHYMAFDIFLKVDSDSELFLTANANVINTSAYDKGIKNSTRVAFLVQGHIPYDQYREGVPVDDNGNGTIEETETTKTEGPVAARNLKGATADDVIIWEPNYDQHTSSAVTAANKYYGMNIGLSDNQLAYNGVLVPIVKGADINNDGIEDVVSLTETNPTKWSQYFAPVTPEIATVAAHSGATTTLTLKAGVTKVRVYFWVEGQDVDAENDATGSDMKLNLEFSIN